jgi:hypothetical protein
MGRRGKLEDLDAFLEEAIGNIRDDRGITSSLLIDLVAHMKQSSDNLKESSLAASKYVETLQRSNEQLVKVANLLQKRERGNDGLSDHDKEELFEIIKGGGEG